jgi:hypothetical protein
LSRGVDYAIVARRAACNHTFVCVSMTYHVG